MKNLYCQISTLRSWVKKIQDLLEEKIGLLTAQLWTASAKGDPCTVNLLSMYLKLK